MSANGEPREREIGIWTKRGITICLFSGLFGIVIIAGGTRPESFYFGLFLIFISILVIIIYMFWWVACKADDFIGRKLDD